MEMRTRTIICALAALGLLIVPLAATPAWVDSAAARAGDASPALASSSLASELPAAVAEAGLSAEDWAGIQRQIAAQEAEPSQPAAGAVSTPDQTEDKKLTANDGAARDYFGNSVAICGDTLVVGAPLADVDGKADQGAAYVFYRHHGGAHNWGQVKKLTASDGHAGDWFGVSVAISGDTILVGAHRDYEFVTFRGSAYVFYRNQGGANNWGQVKRLLASDGREGDYFGGSVAVWGDIALVTADGDDVGANADQGSAYVFYRNHGGTDNWGQVKKLTASDGAAGDSLGTSAAIYGDTAVVGAYGDDIGANADQGSAYAFYRNAGGADNWGQVKKLTASDGAAGDWFGYSAAIWEDTVVVGAYYGKVGANRQGTAYVFSRHLGGADQWGQVQKLSASDGAVGDNFGFSVAISGDLVVAGSPRDDTGTNFDQGSAYVFYRHQGGADNWGQLHKLTASDGAARDYFGASVAMWTGAWVVGADGDDVSANTDQGAAYVFTCGATGPTVSQVTASLDGKAGDDIGTFVSLPGKGVPVLNTFTAQVSPAVCPVQRVTFTLGGQIKTDDNGADGWSAQFDMSELPAGSQDLQVQAYDQGNAGPVKTVKVHVLPKPAYVDGSWVLNPTVSWSAAGQKYTFTGTVPHNPAFGPYVKNFSIRYLGTLHNVFASQVSITETFLISGKWEAKASGALNATLLNVPLAYLPYSVVPHLDSTTGGVAYYDVPTMSFPLEQKKKKVYRGVVYSSGGIFNVSMSIDYGFNATLSTWGTIRGDWSVAKMQLRPDVTASLEFGVWVDILFGVASAGVSATPAFGIGLPVVYQDDPPPGGGSVYLDKPCSHFDVKGRVWASVGWWKLKKTWNWGPYTFYCWDDPSSPSCWCASHAAALALDETQPPEPDLFAAPWLANNGAGKIMAVWIQDQDPDPLEPDPEVAYALWDGTAWSSSQLVTQNDRWESDPRVAFLGPNEALAVWTQNELSPDQTSEETPLTEVLSQQELYYAHWDGVRWTTPARLTHDALPDGRAALASDPLHGQALLAWVHDGDGSPESKGDWDLHYMVWDANGWSTPAPLAADPAVAALEVYLRYDSQG
ncbi:MAG: hypothetical protein FJ026_03505, partial [Chloroflexi bacterium]|nr:hypothetical protein [Chloroflexota bacterium]